MGRNTWSVMDGHSKREVLEVFNMNYKERKKDGIARFLFLNRPPTGQ